jgi:uncharacterized membrane protein YeaQ/YmgE (transglycosylase-associated protein family)
VIHRILVSSVWNESSPHFQEVNASMALVRLVLSDITLSVSTVLWWLVIGLIAGFLASVVMRGSGYGMIGDIIIGIIGAFLGGFLASLVGIGASGLVGTIIIAFLGACILIALLRFFSRRSPRRTRGYTRRRRRRF